MKYLINIFFILLLAGCTQDSPDTRQYAEKTVILVYMGADSDELYKDGSEKIAGMCSGWSGEGNELFIYRDFPEGAGLYRLEPAAGGTARIIPVEDYGTQDHASPANFSRIIDQVISSNPADRYGLVIFSHSTGWLPVGTLQNPGGGGSLVNRKPHQNKELSGPASRSVLSDSYNETGQKNEMELSEFASAIPDGVFDYIIFESCLMAGVEVVFELRNKCRYILASAAEILSPGFLYLYPQYISQLANNNKPSERILQEFATAHMNWVKTSSEHKSGTISLIDTSEIDRLAGFLRTVNKNALQPYDYEQMQYFDMYSARRFADMDDYMSRVVSDSDHQAFRSILNSVVLWSDASDNFLKDHGGFDIERHCGLTIYPGGEHELETAYRNTGWYKATH